MCARSAFLERFIFVTRALAIFTVRQGILINLHFWNVYVTQSYMSMRYPCVKQNAHNVTGALGSDADFICFLSIP